MPIPGPISIPTPTRGCWCILNYNRCKNHEYYCTRVRRSTTVPQNSYLKFIHKCGCKIELEVENMHSTMASDQVDRYRNVGEGHPRYNDHSSAKAVTEFHIVGRDCGCSLAVRPCSPDTRLSNEGSKISIDCGCNVELVLRGKIAPADPRLRRRYGLLFDDLIVQHQTHSRDVTGAKQRIVPTLGGSKGVGGESSQKPAPVRRLHGYQLHLLNVPESQRPASLVLAFRLPTLQTSESQPSTSHVPDDPEPGPSDRLQGSRGQDINSRGGDEPSSSSKKSKRKSDSQQAANNPRTAPHARAAPVVPTNTQSIPLSSVESKGRSRNP